MDEMRKKKAERLLPFAILLVGFLARALLFGELPGGINQDEAFAGYEAWSLLNYGIDTAQYPYPVYLTAWGSGMNALESYLMIPFIAIFGLETWVIRLPQLIMALISLWVCYLTVRKLRDEKTALTAMALLAICPWHIMLSRWGLESNLAPAFLLLGFWFFLKATEKSAYLLLSALMYGLSLYCYATIWVIVPFLVMGQAVYCLAKKQLRFDKYMLAAALLLFLLALPLLLFLAVNFGITDEIKTGYISIPKLLYMRAGELSFKNIPRNLIKLFSLLFKQNDNLPWNSTKFGLLYVVSMPFYLMGIIQSIGSCIKKRGESSLEPLLLMQLLAGIVLGALIDINVNRINIIFISLVIFAACGLRYFCGLFDKKASIALMLIYALLFGAFELYYFTDYRHQIGWYFDEGLEEALEELQDRDGIVYLPEGTHYPKVLFYTETPTDVFAETVEYRVYPAAYLKARSFDRYIFGFDAANPDENANYIIKKGTDLSAFEAAGFSLENCGNYVAAYMPD